MDRDGAPRPLAADRRSLMRRYAELAAWAVLVGLAVLAVLFVNRLGFAGLAVLGLLTLVVCTQVALDQDVPTWGEHVFRERLAPGARRTAGPDLRFFRRCGLFLTVVGVAGFVWQTL